MNPADDCVTPSLGTEHGGERASACSEGLLPAWCQQSTAMRRADCLFQKYLRLSGGKGDEAKRSGVLRLFSKARAASALGFALSEEPGQFHEALYEALASVDDASEVIRRVAKALQR